MKKISRIAVVLAPIAALGAPLLASAANGIDISYITPYSDGIINVINGILVPVLMAVAFIVFLWGIYKYFILGAANESEKGDGRKFAMWGIIGFVIIVSLWGLVNLVMGTLGLSAGTAPPPPTFNPGGGGSPTNYASCMAQYNDPNSCALWFP